MALLRLSGKEVNVILEGDIEFENHSQNIILEAVEIKFVQIFPNINWNIAILANGESVNFGWRCYADSVPFRENFNHDAYNTAIEAETALLNAMESYREAMNALGAFRVEQRDSEDYESWLEVPGIPDRRWWSFD